MLKMIDEELDTLIVGVNNQINHISPYIKKNYLIQWSLELNIVPMS